MAGISLTRKIVQCCFQANVVPALWGYHGTGKTDTIKPATEEWTGQPASYRNFRTINLANYPDGGDLLGLPVIETLKAGQRTQYAVPEFWPMPGDDMSDEAGVIFLDEFNRAEENVMQAMYSFILERRIHNYYLPDKWRIVIACNPGGDNYKVNELDDALFSRFCHVKFTPTFQEWVHWAKSSTDRIDQVVTSFVEEQGEDVLDGENAKKDLDDLIVPTPDRRSHELMSRLYREAVKISNTEKSFLKLIKVLACGMYGDVVGSTFAAYVRDNIIHQPVMGNEILDSYDDHRDKVLKLMEEPQENMSVLKKISTNAVKEIHRRLQINKEHFDFYEIEKDDKASCINGKYVINFELNSFIRFLLDIPKELATSAIKKDLIDNRNKDIMIQIGKVSQYIQSNNMLKDLIAEITGFKAKKPNEFAKNRKNAQETAIETIERLQREIENLGNKNEQKVEAAKIDLKKSISSSISSMNQNETWGNKIWGKIT